MSVCPAPDELTSLALHHLDEAEAGRLQAHVDRCPPCQEALAVWTDLLGQLPLTESPIAPPPDLKRRILGALPPQDLPTQAEPAAKRAPDRLLRHVASRWVGLVATFALVLGSYALWRVERLSPHTIALQGVGPGQGALAQIALYTEGNGTRVSINATGLPPLTDEEVYQLWLLYDQERYPLCSFKVDASGHGEANYWLPGKLEYQSLGVTREPDATATHEPRGPKVLGN
ncbi:MAG TPA: anti-sigma factor [Symbiobacteriaceae bacterium]|nr:anti-sigma factor [Symbiobacteriaceae bacterium]